MPFLLAIFICMTLNGYFFNLNISPQVMAQSIVGVTSPTLTHNNNNNNSNANSSSFPTYQNTSSLGIAIQYPSNWKRITADGKALIFLPPSKKDGFAEKLTIAVFSINGNISVSQLFTGAIDNYGNQYKDFYIVNSMPIILGGKHGYSLTYAYTDPMAGKITAMDIGIKDGNKAYIISYSAQQPEYYTYIYSVEKMIDSFHILSSHASISV